MTPPRPRRHDPGRRERILAACLDVVGEVGVAGASTRRVAAAADVPLGSITYHFTDVGELLRAAFEMFAREVSDRFDERLGAARTPDEARRAVVDLIRGDVPTDPRELILTQELYTLAARDPAYRPLTHEWMARSRRGLERHFEPTTARLLDAMIEGLTLHRALETEERGDEEVVRAVALLTRGGDAAAT